MSENEFRSGKIYKIQCKDDDTLTYIGSTINSLNERFGHHKGDSKTFPNRLFYKNVLQRKNKWDDWFIELVEYYPCNSEEELIEREELHIAKMGTLNSRPFRVRKNIKATPKIVEILTDNETIYHCPCGRKITEKYMCHHLKAKGHIEYENEFLIKFMFERFNIDEVEAKIELQISKIYK
jgi:hypothetical protein